MTENNIYSLARTLQQTGNLERDFSQMLSALQNTIETEYLQKIRSAAKEERALCVEHPPREVTLLRALSAFTDEKGRRQIDRMAEGLLFLHTMQNIQQNVQSLSGGNLLAARSAGNTPADVPSLQSAQMAGLLLTLALTEYF